MDREALWEEEPAEESPGAQGKQHSRSEEEEGPLKAVLDCSRGHQNKD